jgi:hypothetical protein
MFTLASYLFLFLLLKRSSTLKDFLRFTGHNSSAFLWPTSQQSRQKKLCQEAVRILINLGLIKTGKFPPNLETPLKTVKNAALFTHTTERGFSILVNAFRNFDCSDLELFNRHFSGTYQAIWPPISVLPSDQYNSKVLIYAPPGAGKTTLLKSGMFPGFIDTDFGVDKAPFIITNKWEMIRKSMFSIVYLPELTWFTKLVREKLPVTPEEAQQMYDDITNFLLTTSPAQVKILNTKICNGKYLPDLSLLIAHEVASRKLEISLLPFEDASTFIQDKLATIDYHFTNSMKIVDPPLAEASVLNNPSLSPPEYNFAAPTAIAQAAIATNIFEEHVASNLENSTFSKVQYPQYEDATEELHEEIDYEGCNPECYKCKFQPRTVRPITPPPLTSEQIFEESQPLLSESPMEVDPEPTDCPTCLECQQLFSNIFYRCASCRP